MAPSPTRSHLLFRRVPRGDAAAMNRGWPCYRRVPFSTFRPRFAQMETVHPVFDPSLGSGEVGHLLSLLPRHAKARMTSSSMAHCIGQLPANAATPRCDRRPARPPAMGTRPRPTRCNAIGKHRRPKWLVQDCCGCWVFPFPFSCSCGRSVGCTRHRPSRLVPTRQRMNGIFYLVG